MNSLPLVPRQTVVLLPRRTKVNTSPYCELGQIFLSKEAGPGAPTDLFLTPEKKSIGINAIDDGAAEERHPVENQGRFIRISEYQLLEYIKDYREDAKCSEAGASNDPDGSGRESVA